MNDTKLTPVTEEEKVACPAHGIVKLEEPFVDGRGSIKPLVDTPFKLTGKTDSIL